MGWNRDEGGAWRREDGVRILRDTGSQRTQFVVATVTGTRLTQAHNKATSSTPRRFASEAAAMRAADKAWPETKRSAV